MTPHPDKELLTAHADGAAPASERERLEAHLSDCADCRREVEEQRSVSKLVAGLPQAELPAGFLARLERRRREGGVPAARVAPGLSPLRLAAFAATGILVCLIFFHEVRYRMAPEMMGAAGGASDELQTGPAAEAPMPAADAEQAAVDEARRHVAERGAWSGMAQEAAPAENAFSNEGLDAGAAGSGGAPAAGSGAPARAALRGGAPLGTQPSSSNEAIHNYLEKEKSRMGIQQIIPPEENAPAAEALPDHPVSRAEAMSLMRSMTRRLTRINEEAADKKRPSVALGSGATPRLLTAPAPSRPVEEAKAEAAAPMAAAAPAGSLSMIRGEGARVDEPASFEPESAPERQTSASAFKGVAAKKTAGGRTLTPVGAWSSTLGGLGKAGGAVITNPADWADLWSRVGRADPLPAADFSKQMVVAVFGARDDAKARSVAIVSLSEEDGALVIRYRVKEESGPGPSAPYAAVLAPKSELPFSFVQVP